MLMFVSFTSYCTGSGFLRWNVYSVTDLVHFFDGHLVLNVSGILEWSLGFVVVASLKVDGW